VKGGGGGGGMATTGRAARRGGGPSPTSESHPHRYARPMHKHPSHGYTTPGMGGGGRVWKE
jgi:hypothetical protein